MRQNDLAFEVRDYLKGHPNAAVVNLGCGLDCTGRSCDNGSCKIYNLDFPDVIAVRNELLPAGGAGEKYPLRPERHGVVFSNRCFKRRGVLCLRRVLLLSDRAGQSTCADHGRCLSRRHAGI